MKLMLRVLLASWEHPVVVLKATCCTIDWSVCVYAFIRFTGHYGVNICLNFIMLMFSSSLDCISIYVHYSHYMNKYFISNIILTTRYCLKSSGNILIATLYTSLVTHTQASTITIP